MYVPPLPNHLPELRHRIEEAIASITPNLLTEVGEVGEGLDFRLDVCRITKGVHIEHLKEKPCLFTFDLMHDLL